MAGFHLPITGWFCLPTDTKALHGRVREYEQILGHTMQHLHEVIGVAELAASLATAIQEDSRVFDEMFAESV